MTPVMLTYAPVLANALLDLCLAVLIARLLLVRSQNRAMGGLMAVTLSACLLTTTLAMRGDDDTPLYLAVGQVLSHTHAGWMIELGLFACLLLAIGLRPLTYLATLLLVYARAASGHAADQGWLSSAVGMQMLHLLAISLWAGSVIVCAQRASQRGTLPSDLARRLSLLSTIALSAVLISGLLNFARIRQAVAISAWSPYSAWFYAKLVCIIMAVALGAYNRWFTLPGVLQGRHQSEQRFVRVLHVEALILILTIFLAAKLGATMPS